MKKIVFLFIVAIAGFMSSCSYNVYVPEEAPPVDSTKVYSFATDIQPIFDADGAGCNTGSCHNPGVFSLLPGESYANIVPARINESSPELSAIYEYPLVSNGHYKTYSVEQAQSVLQWIKQGALNN